ncbi:MAG: GldG family protein [Microcystaceae cyanobacterium]
MPSLSSFQKYIKYLFVPGLILAIAGLVAGLTTGNWSPLPVGLLVTGLIILVLWLGLLLNSTPNFWRRRSTQVGTNALVATLSVLIILGLINFLAARYLVRIDLTENQLFTLSPQSQELVKNLPQPLKVFVFDREPNIADRKLLENYRRYGSNFAFEFVDPQIDIGLAKQFNVQSPGDVYLEYGTKKQLVQTLSPVDSLSEIKLTNAIEQIQRDRLKTIFFLQGHGEPDLQASEGGLAQAVSSLEDKGYKVESLNLAERSTIPKDANVIIVASPKRKLFAGEIKALKDYLDRGGSLLLMLDPDTNPGLDQILKEWGIQLDNRIIIDASGAGNSLHLGPATPLITNYGKHPITKDFANGISVYPLSRSIGTVKVKGVDASALLITSPQTWAESNLNSETIEFNPTQDIQGPFDLGVAFTRTESRAINTKEDKNINTLTPPTSESSKKKPQKIEVISPPEASPSSKINTSNQTQKKLESRLIVFGNSTFATNGWLEQQLNKDVFLNSVQWLTNDRQTTLSIHPKEPKDRQLNLTPLQAGLIGWLALLIVPLLGLMIAVFTWWRRR